MAVVHWYEWQLCIVAVSGGCGCKCRCALLWATNAKGCSATCFLLTAHAAVAGGIWYNRGGDAVVVSAADVGSKSGNRSEHGRQRA
jgi:hypothetical protein